MKQYSVMPQDWDYTHEEEINQYNEKGCYTPYEIQEVVDNCGSLYPLVKSKSSAIEYVKNLKKKFPFIIFDLMVGETWGNLEVIESF